MTYHCDKLCSNACCAPLRWALDMCATIDAGKIVAQAHQLRSEKQLRLSAYNDVHDPAKLAELGAMALRARGFSVVVVAPDIQRWKAPNHLSIRWHNDEIGVYDDGLMTCLIAESYTLAEFRALLARIMTTPPDASIREQCERLIRGDGWPFAVDAWPNEDELGSR